MAQDLGDGGKSIEIREAGGDEGQLRAVLLVKGDGRAGGGGGPHDLQISLSLEEGGETEAGEELILDHQHAGALRSWRQHGLFFAPPQAGQGPPPIVASREKGRQMPIH